jgi:photosystem II stability/assembly factor-like uncharacterized protein
MKKIFSFLVCFIFILQLKAQQKPGKKKETQPEQTVSTTTETDSSLRNLKWRNIGPFRGGRSVTATGVVGDPLVYYMGTTGGGVWKTFDAGGNWQNISDGYFTTGSVGAVAVSERDPNVVFVGMGEHAPRGVSTSYGDGVYKSTDAGKTWKKMGLALTRHIANIRIHPINPDVVYIAAQGALHGSSEERGIYKSTDGGTTWKKILYVDENTGCSDLSIDMTNPRILYAAMWDHRRLPWEVKSGGKGSGLYKSTDGGETWTKLNKGLPKEKGKMAIEVSRSNPDKVYALIESDTEKEHGGLFVSDDAGKSWNRISKDHRLVQRAWYYIEIAIDPNNENVVYVFNSPGLRSIDGGKTWSNIRGTHGDYHQLWINPDNSKNMVIANDGGAAISFNTGKTWSTQSNQPTGQFYRVNADNLFPYNVYGGQQDNTSVMIASRNLAGSNIGEKNWSASAGGESAFIAFDPNNPRFLMGGSYQGTIELFDQEIKEGKGIMVSPVQYQSLQPKNMKYRFNWNAPIINSPTDPTVFYHAGNVLFRTNNKGINWEAISPDLTRHDTAKMGMSGVPYTNEGAGGENYGTIAYVAESPYEKGVIWTGSDDGLVYLSKDNGKTWTNVTPAGIKESLINCIDVSPHDKATAYIATTRYKVNDFTPAIYKTTDYGKTWTNISSGIPYGAYTRTVREDDVKKDLLYAGTETGFYISYNGGKTWKQQQLNLPLTPITDLKVHKGNLIASTMGRAFWILDDLAIFRQYNRSDTTKRFDVFKTTDAYRVSGGSALDASVDDDDAPPPIYNSGTNPPTGVSIYYLVPAKPDSIKLTLDILDDKGQLVRSYSTKPDKKFVKFPGGPDADALLPGKPGLNRFVWDMRYATLPGVPNVFIEGSYQGRKVAPGKYIAKLKTGKEEKTTAITILPDPRIKATETEYLQQQQTLAEVDNKIKEMHDAVNQMRIVRKQVNDLLELLTDTVTFKPVIESGKKLVKKITVWEEKLVQPKAQSNDDIINFVNMLSADYIFLKGEMDVNIPAVTNGQQQRLTELNTQWQPIKNEYSDIQKQVVDFNALCRKLNIEKITIPEAAI